VTGSTARLTKIYQRNLRYFPSSIIKTSVVQKHSLKVMWNLSFGCISDNLVRRTRLTSLQSMPVTLMPTICGTSE